MDSYEGNSSDPASLHKYLYCKANPINGRDLSGHEFDLGFDIGMIDSNWLNPVMAPQVALGFVANGSPTHIGDILNEFFSPFSKERVWVMGPDDHYTQIVRKWQPVIDAVNKAKADCKANKADWNANHTTTSNWTPGASYAHDPRAWGLLVQSPLGTDPDTAENYFAIWRASGVQMDGLYTSAIGSFDIFVTLDNASTMKVWMFNLMSRHSLGRFAKYFPLSGMANQWMWWDWTENAF